MRRAIALGTLSALLECAACGMLDSANYVEAPAPVDASADGPDASVDAGVDAPDDALSDAGMDADADAAPRKARVFVTRRTFAANMGGLMAAATLCAEDAVDAGVGGSWAPWLSDDNVDARDRIGPGPFYNTAGELVISRVDIINSQAPKASIRTWSGPSPAYVWTGTLASGIRSGSSCLSWSTTLQNKDATVGSMSDFGQWTNCGASCPSQTCDNTFALICFEN